jgi:hypothetical protein
VACLWPFVRRLRNSRTSSGEIEDKSLAEKLSLNRKRTYSQVLTVFFLGICSMILKMIVYCLGNFHCRTSFVLKSVVWFSAYEIIPKKGRWTKEKRGAYLRYISISRPSWQVVISGCHSNPCLASFSCERIPPCQDFFLNVYPIGRRRRIAAESFCSGISRSMPATPVIDIPHCNQVRPL